MKLMRWIGVVAMLFVAGCGGGGGSDSDGSGTPRFAGSPADLLPTAPVLGTVLAADAVTLRPLRAGAVWTYLGTQLLSPTSRPTTYETTTRHTLSAGVYDERYSNSSNSGADSQLLTVQGGRVTQSQRLDFAGKGEEETIELIELRSPVRVGDQYTSHSRRYLNTNIDSDRDGKPDALDVVLYGRVVGSERLRLSNLPAVDAVRVDLVFRIRVIPSSTGAPGQVTEVSIATWYAAGIGIVRQLTTEPSADGTTVATTDETLVAWDAQDAGFGSMQAVVATVPATAAEYAGSAINGVIYGVAPTPGGPLVLTPLPGMTSNDTGMLATRLDLRGTVVSTVAHRTLRFQFPMITGHAGGFAILDIGAPNQNFTGLPALTRLDSNGAIVGVPGGQLLDLLEGRPVARIYQVAKPMVDGSLLWVLWNRTYQASFGADTELVLRAFRLEGAPAGPEIVLERGGVSNGQKDLQLAAAGGRALATWNNQGNGVELSRYALATSNAVTSVVTLDGTVGSGGQLPLMAGGKAFLLWPTPLGTGRTVSSDGRMGAVQLDANGQLLLPAGSTLGALRLAGAKTQDPVGIDSTGSKLAFVNRQGFPADGVDRVTTPGAVTVFTPGSGPLSPTAAVVVGIPVSEVSHLAVYDDRMILLAGDSFSLRTVVVWLSGT